MHFGKMPLVPDCHIVVLYHIISRLRMYINSAVYLSDCRVVIICKPWEMRTLTILCGDVNWKCRAKSERTKQLSNNNIFFWKIISFLKLCSVCQEYYKSSNHINAITRKGDTHNVQTPHPHSPLHQPPATRPCHTPPSPQPANTIQKKENW